MFSEQKTDGKMGYIPYAQSLVGQDKIEWLQNIITQKDQQILITDVLMSAFYFS